MIPLSLDWGEFTADGYDSKTNEALFVYNFDLEANNYKRINAFIIGRSIWANMNLPKECSQKIVFDIRGQVLHSDKIDELFASILAGLTKAGVKNKITLEVFK